MLDRLKLIITDENINKIKNKKVLVVGLGGVGGTTFINLVRNGFNDIYVCDYDTFEISNLNRQELSNLNNINKYKVDEAENYAKNINKDINIHKINTKLTKENIYDVLPANIDYIVDCADDIKVKIELVKFALSNNIKIITSGGVGNRLDPRCLEITNIWKTYNDPLLKSMRNLLKKENINYKLPVVFSKEIPIKTSSNVGSYSGVVNYAGILLSYYVLNDILNN